MSYRIKAYKVTMVGTGKPQQIESITVLFDLNGLDNPYIDIRATQWSQKTNEQALLHGGYLYLGEEEQVISDELLQIVAGGCLQISVEQMKKMFPA